MTVSSLPNPTPRGVTPVRGSIESLEPRRLGSATVTPAPDAVIQWDNVMLAAIRADRTQPGPTRSSRNMAVVSLAIFDAVNGIDGSYQSYLVKQKAPSNAQVVSAVAGAAYEALVRLYPRQRALFDWALESSLLPLHHAPGTRSGRQWGRSVADQILANRKADGSADMTPYVQQAGPGHWRPDPLNPKQMALGPGWGMVKPFDLQSSSQFAPPPPPALNSKAYADAVNEVKSLGAKNSTTRTADETQVGRFWAYDRAGMGPPTVLYDEVTQTIAEQMHNTLVQNARLFALVNMAQADAAIVAWSCKYTNDLWRPITAIRQANLDGNPLTKADKNWVPLGAPGDGVVNDFTPPFPSYVSGHATIGAATFTTLARFYGTNNIHFTLTSDELPGVTRSYTSFSQASTENGRSRIYLGIHYNFDDFNGRHTGDAIANYIFHHALQPAAAGAAGGAIHTATGSLKLV